MPISPPSPHTTFTVGGIKFWYEWRPNGRALLHCGLPLNKEIDLANADEVYPVAYGQVEQYKSKKKGKRQNVTTSKDGAQRRR